MGTILALVLRAEIHAMQRLPRAQACVSSGRLVTCAKASTGQRDGTSGQKIGQASLTWAFSEAAVWCVRNHPAGQTSRARLARRQGKGQAVTVLAHPVARAVYDMCKRETAGDRDKFLHA